MLKRGYKNLKILSKGMWLLVFIIITSCKKFVEVEPPTDQISSDAVFTNEATATSAITGIYTEMMKAGQQFSAGFMTLYSGMAADELKYYSPGLNEEFINNNITPANHELLSSSFWQPAYRYIYSANLCIEKLTRSKELSNSVKLQLIGEAKFVRAFCYFNLVNLFGDIPLIINSDYMENIRFPRTPINEVYSQIIKDLTDAIQLLLEEYPSSEKIRPNKWAASALLARVYLYTNDWRNAEAMSTAIINSGKYRLENDLNNVFLNGSNEAIWQLRPVNPAHNTWEGFEIVPSSDYTPPAFLIRDNLLAAFEAGDLRKTNWIASRTFSGQTMFYSYKYKLYDVSNGVSEYYSVFRLAEQYLIRSEALLQQNKLNEALPDLNMIRSRAGLNDFTISSREAGLLEVEHERQVELFAEWGHRWLDLKRTGRVDEVLSALKPQTWHTTDRLWPIPNDQIKANPLLIQNTGY